jgi:hypothetical protein
MGGSLGVGEGELGWGDSYSCGGFKYYKGGYRIASKIKDKGFEADLYTKH